MSVDVLLLALAVVMSAALVWLVWADMCWHRARIRRADRDIARLVEELRSCQCPVCEAARRER